MSSELAKLAEEVTDEASFLVFVRALSEDRRSAVDAESKNPSSSYGPDAGEWENSTIETYLEACVAWAEDSQFGRRMALSELELHDATAWRRFAAFLVAGTVYE